MIEDGFLVQVRDTEDGPRFIVVFPVKVNAGDAAAAWQTTSEFTETQIRQCFGDRADALVSSARAAFGEQTKA